VHRHQPIAASLALAAVLLAGCKDGDPASPVAVPPDRATPLASLVPLSHQVFGTITSNAFPGEHQAAEGLGSFPIAELPGGVLEGVVVYVGRGCPDDPDNGVSPEDPYLADPAGSIALIQRGECVFAHKIARAQLAGATGVIVHGFEEFVVTMDIQNPTVMPDGSEVPVTIAAAFVTHSTGILLRDGTPPVTAVVTPMPEPTPLQLLDHLDLFVDVLVAIERLTESQTKPLKALLAATRQHIENGNNTAAASTLDAFLRHLYLLTVVGDLTQEDAEFLEGFVNAVLSLL
jgi:hypothetical protein